MRIVAGRFGGRRLTAPPGLDTRPTGDRVRESLFSILGPLHGARVLDLFAGTGALGLEALSRGAAHATFVERDRRALDALGANIDAFGLDQDEALVVRGDYRRALRDAGARGEAYDLVLLDPPYRDASGIAPVLDTALRPLLREGATVVTESDRRSPMHLDLGGADERRYGDTLIRIHRP
ncbi:16S rRNA (guanine(966)-N(2))-methyltransferase RsmD [Patulibacter minatonensis]|uniref:16S rRNA (guanine(966)-N(2))-methyltransferase RsmD n=1 Tax=Patulibacter minatonensis TaxID=298163 RepID=UPI00047EBE05|nr:16S rRNA (guanine(966)-N(2))-methyltransferase RsmD [Patulibacter minatonensis]